MTGNVGTNPTTHFIGTTDTSSFALKTNNQDAIRITSNGNVGIGTTSPQAKLNVAGDTKISGNLTISSLNSTERSLVIVNETGGLERYMPPGLCQVQTALPWMLAGNWFDDVFPASYNFLGTCSNTDLLIGTNGQDRIHITSNGYVGVGSSSPGAKLGIVTEDNTSSTAAILIKNSTSATLLKLQNDGTLFFPGSIQGQHTIGDAALSLNGNTSSIDGATLELYGSGGTRQNEVRVIGKTIRFFYYNSAGAGSWDENMTINSNGQVGIDWNFSDPGHTVSDYKLAVNGKIIATGARVQISSDWPDYVFDQSHRLMSLSKLETYVYENKHLPDLPSAKEVGTDGIDLGEMNRIIVEKVEELSLYIIDLQKQINELKVNK
ncbi:MAG: hypothetical protein ABIQ74_10840 [Chitinophagales bacterium]